MPQAAISRDVENDSGSPTVYIVSTRPPKKPLSGGMAPAVREACLAYGEDGQEAKVFWWALGSEGDKTAMRKEFDQQTITPLHQPVPVSSYEVEGFNVRQVQLSREHWTSHYDEFCNRWIWPICHNLPQYAKEKISNWDIQGNNTVNDLIAQDMAFELNQKKDTTSPILIQDYHHFKLAMYLHRYGVENPLIFFNHIPMPTMETFNNMRPKEQMEFREMMNSLLKCDSVQFQTEETARRFLKIVGYKNPPAIGAYQSVVVPVEEEGQPVRHVRVGHAPISINVDKVMRTAASPEPLQAAHSQWLEDQLVAQNILLNFERCDYSKGIIERVEAFEELMEVRPDLRGKVQLVLQAEPTRDDIPEYKKYAQDVKDMVERINKDDALKIGDKPPVIFLNANIPNEDLLKIMRRSKDDIDGMPQRRIGTVTPFADGMNLTAKEFAASQDLTKASPLILSAGAGAAAELDLNGRGAVTYRPAETGNPTPLVNAMVRAIDMSQEEANDRAGVMQAAVKGNSIQDWGRYMKDESDLILKARGTEPMPGIAALPTFTLDL